MKNTASRKLQLYILDYYQPENNQDKEFKLFLVLQKIWQNWVAAFRTSNDLQIWQTIDRLGNTWWHAYNPVTGCFATRESETQLLEWIERRLN
jgi:hypothetical protein